MFMQKKYLCVLYSLILLSGCQPAPEHAVPLNVNNHLSIAGKISFLADDEYWNANFILQETQQASRLKIFNSLHQSTMEIIQSNNARSIVINNETITAQHMLHKKYAGIVDLDNIKNILLTGKNNNPQVTVNIKKTKFNKKLGHAHPTRIDVYYQDTKITMVVRTINIYSIN